MESNTKGIKPVEKGVTLEKQMRLLERVILQKEFQKALWPVFHWSEDCILSKERLANNKEEIKSKIISYIKREEEAITIYDSKSTGRRIMEYLFVLWSELGIEGDFPVPETSICSNERSWKRTKKWLSKRMFGEGAQQQIDAYAKTAPVLHLTGISFSLPKLIENARKQEEFQAMQSRLTEYKKKRTEWLAKVDIWRSENKAKSAYHENHPEELKFQELSNKLEKKIQDLSRKRNRPTEKAILEHYEKCNMLGLFDETGELDFADEANWNQNQKRKKRSDPAKRKASKIVNKPKLFQIRNSGPKLGSRGEIVHNRRFSIEYKGFLYDFVDLEDDPTRKTTTLACTGNRIDITKGLGGWAKKMQKMAKKEQSLKQKCMFTMKLNYRKNRKIMSIDINSISKIRNWEIAPSSVAAWESHSCAAF